MILDWKVPACSEACIRCLDLSFPYLGEGWSRMLCRTRPRKLGRTRFWNRVPPPQMGGTRHPLPDFLRCEDLVCSLAI